MDQALLEKALTRQAVIFDFDGVLAKIQVDWPALKQELQELFTKETGACGELTPFDLKLNEILKTASETLTERVNRTIESYELADFDHHLVFPEMLAIAKNLVANGIPLFICSSNTRKVIEQILIKTGTSNCFRQIVSRENVLQRKPDPEGLLTILSENALSGDQVLFVGDREIDQIAGKAAGIETLLVQPDEPIYLAELPPRVLPLPWRVISF